MRAGDGNETDREAFGQLFVEYKKRLNLDSILVAACALYSERNLLLMRDLWWITRVPLSIKLAKELIEKLEILPIEIGEDLSDKERDLRKKSQEKGYKWVEKIVEYKGLTQRWLIVESAERRKSDIDKLQKKREKEQQKIAEKLVKLEKKEFVSEQEAEEELKLNNQSSKFFSLQITNIIESPHKKKEKIYKLQLKIEENTEIINQKMTSAGRFILATNILNEQEITSAEILLNYKEQQGVERGFGFLKDPLFFADSFFVKTPARIETILWLMSLCLLIYNLGQRELRNNLRKSNSSVKNQVGKLINNPTLRWIFHCFQGIHLLKINDNQQIFNLTTERSFILRFLPYSCYKYYQ
jgi:transposase